MYLAQTETTPQRVSTSNFGCPAQDDLILRRKLTVVLETFSMLKEGEHKWISFVNDINTVFAPAGYQ